VGGGNRLTGGGVVFAAALSVSAIVPSSAGCQTRALPRTLASGPLDAMLRRLASDTDLQILFDPAIAAGRRGPAVAAGTPLASALTRLLGGLSLVARPAGPGIFVVEPAQASARPVAGAQADSDVVVTASRRPTLLGDTGMSVAVTTGTALADKRVVDQRGLTRVMPALVAVSTGPLQQRLSVRGVSGTGENTVGVYYGETPVSAPSGTGFDPAAMAPDIDLIDVERIELLKGPQGTLYGAGSMGGTLRTLFHAADPSSASAVATGEAGVTAHGGPSGALSAVVNLPLVRDRLAVRAVVGRRRIGGVIDNRLLGYRDGDWTDRASERLSMTWTPGSNIRLEAMVLEQRIQVGDAGVRYEINGPFRADTPVRVPNSERLDLATATLHWAPGPLRVTATASHYRWRITKETDFTRVLARQRDDTEACRRYAASIGAGGACDAPALARYRDYVDSRLPAILYQPMQVGSSSGEIRFADDGNGGVRWTAGLFVESRDDAVQSNTVRADPASGQLIQPLDITGLRLIDTRLDQQALYAEASQSLGGGLTATLGARAYHYRRVAGGSVVVPNVITNTGTVASRHYRTDDTGSNLKGEIAWRGPGRLLVYVLASEGFRPGGVNITPELSDAERVYRADHLWNYELGVKAPNLAHGLSLEAAAFHIDWRDAIFVANSANGAFLYNTNLASVDIDGAEGRVSLATGNVQMAAIASWTNARLAQDTLLGTSEGRGHAGDRLPNVPALAFTITMDGNWVVDESRNLWLSVGSVTSGSGATVSTFDQASLYRERTPPRFQLDLYAQLQRGGWSMRLGIDNLLDSASPTRVLSNAFGERQIYGARPRTMTLTVSRSW
jgi:outer membrane receptor protein involved in Fe transport